MKKVFKLFLVICAICCTMNGNANEVYSFKKVEQISAVDTTDRYIIASVIGDSVAYVWNGKDEAKGYVEFDIMDSLNLTYSGTLAPVMVKFEESDGKMYTKISGGENDGKYFSGAKGANKLNFTKGECEMAFDSIGNFILTSNTSVMRFNSNSNNLRFRFFQIRTYKNQKDVQLYKLMKNGDITVSIDNVEVNSKAFKTIVNGQVVIERDGIKYNALGALLEE